MVQEHEQKLLPFAPFLPSYLLFQCFPFFFFFDLILL